MKNADTLIWCIGQWALQFEHFICQTIEGINKKCACTDQHCVCQSINCFLAVCHWCWWTSINYTCLHCTESLDSFCCITDTDTSCLGGSFFLCLIVLNWCYRCSICHFCDWRLSGSMINPTKKWNKFHSGICNGLCIFKSKMVSFILLFDCVAVWSVVVLWKSHVRNGCNGNCKLRYALSIGNWLLCKQKALHCIRLLCEFMCLIPQILQN